MSCAISPGAPRMCWRLSALLRLGLLAALAAGCSGLSTSLPILATTAGPTALPAATQTSPPAVTLTAGAGALAMTPTAAATTRVEPQATVVAAATTYTVVAGDTIWGIAQRFG